jgi:hypothetical protein
MTLDDITGKAKEFLSNSKVTDALHSEKAEAVSDSLLDKVADAADKVTGGKFHDQIDSARDEADKHIGDQ